MQDLGALSATSFSEANAINDIGEIVGSSQTPDTSWHAVRWTPGGIPLDLGTLGGRQSAAGAINSLGVIVGTSGTLGGRSHAFVWDSGSMVDLGTLSGGLWSRANGINNARWVVGAAGTDPDGPYAGVPHAVAWRPNGSIEDLNDVDDSSTWTLLEAMALNESGLIVGSGIAPDGSHHAFLLRPQPALPAANIPGLMLTAMILMLIGLGALAPLPSPASRSEERDINQAARVERPSETLEV
jgi:probable HAF family extracellular repeat protein